MENDQFHFLILDKKFLVLGWFASVLYCITLLPLNGTFLVLKPVISLPAMRSFCGLCTDW